MNHNKLLRFAEMFYSLATSEEVPKDSKDVPTVLKNLENLETYAARKKYAEANLKHLSSGSARIVYLTPDKTVVKLAKNDKGIAQNKAETNPKMKSKFLNEVIKHADNDAWMETYYLEKITGKEFEEMTKIPFSDFEEAIRFGLKNVSENTGLTKPKNFDKVSGSEIYKEMKRIGEQFKLMPGDLARISSWGTKDGRPVLIDAGLTAEVFADYYEDDGSSSKSS
jgi:uncharacterized protein YpmB